MEILKQDVLLNMENLTNELLAYELEKADDDIKNGRYSSLEDVISQLNRKNNKIP